MKKISLKDIKESMSRSEMKTIMAGSYSGTSTDGCKDKCCNSAGVGCCQYWICDMRMGYCIAT